MCSCESFFVNLTMITSTIDNTCVSPLLLLLLLLVRRTGRHKTGLLMCVGGGDRRANRVRYHRHVKKKLPQRTIVLEAV